MVKKQSNLSVSALCQLSTKISFGCMSEQKHKSGLSVIFLLTIRITRPINLPLIYYAIVIKGNIIFVMKNQSPTQVVLNLCCPNSRHLDSTYLFEYKMFYLKYEAHFWLTFYSVNPEDFLLYVDQILLFGSTNCAKILPWVSVNTHCGFGQPAIQWNRVSTKEFLNNAHTTNTFELCNK